MTKRCNSIWFSYIFPSFFAYWIMLDVNNEFKEKMCDVPLKNPSESFVMHRMSNL